MTSVSWIVSIVTDHTDLIGIHFQMSPLWTVFSNGCIFDETFIVLVRAIGRSIIKNTSVYVEIKTQKLGQG